MNAAKIILTHIVFIFILSLTGFAQTNPCERAGLPYSSLPGDTTIVLKHGTRLTFNRCEFFDIRDCLEMEEAFDTASIRRLNLSTMDIDGNFLLTAGMLTMHFNKDCPDKKCFEIPVRVRMPLRIPSCATCENLRGFRLYTTANSNDGAWSDTTSIRYNIVDSGGMKYLDFVINCPDVGFNADCKMPTTRVKFKARSLARLDSVKIDANCPIGVLNYAPKNGRRKVKVKIPCFFADSVKVYARGLSSNGNDWRMKKLLGELEHVAARKKCKMKKPKLTNLFGLFSKRKGSIYRKYYIQ